VEPDGDLASSQSSQHGQRNGGQFENLSLGHKFLWPQERPLAKNLVGKYANLGIVIRTEGIAGMIGAGVTLAGARLAVAPSWKHVVDGTNLAIVTACWPSSPGISGWL
jgi:hypothetical protein